MAPPVPPRILNEPTSKIGKWLHAASIGDGHHETHPWWKVLWLTGVDYFSTLGYQPGIALLAAGAMSPFATFFVVIVTLFAALPTYAQVAKRSFAGQGSIAMLEDLLPGWVGKAAVLALIGFAATDFVITVTLSAADAAQHAIENPVFHPFLGEARMLVTLALLVALAIVFLRGFREAIGVAMVAAIPYLILNLVVVIRGAIEVVHHPEVFSRWSLELSTHGDWTMVLLVSGILFPKLALGMSGFETGVTVMPLVKGAATDEGQRIPWGRVRATRKLLLAAAVIMSFFLISTSLMTTLLIPPEAYHEGGPAAGRAVAYLAHELLGHGFGTLFDISTMTILWFAGASATAGLLHLIPRYLPRFGMAPLWVSRMRPLVLILLGIEILVTLIFRADVEAQAGAYATGVLVLMLSAAVAVMLAFLRERRMLQKKSSESGRDLAVATFCFLYFAGVTLVFGFTLVENVIFRPDGIIIASIFIFIILTLSALSRLLRSTELRVDEILFADEESAKLWPLITKKKVNLIPLHRWNRIARVRKTEEVRKYYSVHGPLAFLHVHLVDDRSEFAAKLRMKIRRDGDDYTIEVFGAVAIANTIACVSELVDPVSVFLGLGRKNLMSQAFGYVFWGEGEVGILVYTILLRYWDATVEDDVRPLIFLMSE